MGVGRSVDGEFRHLSPFVVLHLEREVDASLDVGECGVGEFEFEDSWFSDGHSGLHGLFAVYLWCLDLHGSCGEDVLSGIEVFCSLFAFVELTGLSVGLAEDVSPRPVIHLYFVHIVCSLVFEVDDIGVK